MKKISLHEPVRKVRTRRTISPEEKRRVTVYLRGPKVDGLYSERIKLQEAISRFYGTKRKWTFSFDDRIFTCDLTAKEIEDLKKNTDIIEKIVEHKEDEVGIMISYPYPDFDPDNENIDWGVSAINAPTAWNAGYTGKGIKLAIIDTGVAYNHIDLKDRYVAGYNAINGSNDPLDDHGHGTWCAGIACASANDIGYKGVAPEVDLYAVKVLSAQGSGTWADLAAGIDWATQQGVDVISMSLGGTASDETVENACANAWARGIIIVVAAGNNGPGMDSVTYPAKYSSCMAVAAIDYQKYVAWFSSRGPEVEIAAPGVGVTGCWPGRHLDMYGDGEHFVGDYWYWANGTCLTGDTEIYTPSGPKQIKDLKEGDEVFCFDKGQLTKNRVKKLLRQGIKKVFKIETSDGKNIKATSNHPFLVSKTRSSRLVWKPVSELRTGDLLVAVNKLPETIDSFFDSLITEKMAMALGFFLADGWVQKSHKKNRIYLAKGNKEKTKTFKEAFEDVFNVRFKEADKWYVLSSKRLALVLSLLGLKQPHQKAFLPQWIYHISHNKIKAFIHGFLGGDGYYTKNCNCCRLEIASKELANGLKHLCRYVGYKATDIRERTRLNKAPNSPNKLKEYRISYTLWINFNGHRKSTGLSKVADINWFHSATVKNIEPVGMREVFDIEVENSHNFLANGIVVHNSGACPHVSGAACLVKQWYPRATNQEIRDFLNNNAEDL